MKFRKLPVAIDAFRYWKDSRPDWFNDKVTSNDIITHSTHCEIKTLEGVMRGEAGDWIIRGVAGEIYPCKPDIFARTYERDLGPDPRAVMSATRRLVTAGNSEDAKAALAEIDQMFSLNSAAGAKQADDELQIGVTAAKRSGLVIVSLRLPVTTVSLDYEQAMDLSNGIRDRAFELRGITK